MSPSTKHPEDLPAPAVLKTRIRALALLDEIIEPRWDSRYYSFTRSKDGSFLGSMRNGEGDLWFARFIPGGAAVLRGFDHDSVMSPFRSPERAPWPGLFDGMPASLRRWRNAVDVEPEEVTFVLWHPRGDHWRIGRVKPPPGDDPDGSERLLASLDGDPVSYRQYAAERWNRDIPVDILRDVYEGYIDGPIILALNPQASVDAILQSARDMRFPMAKKQQARKSTASAPKTDAKAAAQPVKWRRAGAATFSVAVHDNKVELLVHGKAVATRDVDGPEFYNALFKEVRKRIAGDA